jgi:hypothetical protein
MSEFPKHNTSDLLAPHSTSPTSIFPESSVPPGVSLLSERPSSLLASFSRKYSKHYVEYSATIDAAPRDHEYVEISTKMLEAIGRIVNLPQPASCASSVDSPDMDFLDKFPALIDALKILKTDIAEFRQHPTEPDAPVSLSSPHRSSLDARLRELQLIAQRQQRCLQFTMLLFNVLHEYFRLRIREFVPPLQKCSEAQFSKASSHASRAACLKDHFSLSATALPTVASLRDLLKQSRDHSLVPLLGKVHEAKAEFQDVDDLHRQHVAADFNDAYATLLQSTQTFLDQ